MKIHWLQHVPFEKLGSIQDWADARHHSLAATRLHQGEALPGIEEIDWLIVMGGPMGVNDEAEFEWLRPEKELIRQAIGQKKRVLGICLGAQLIASALGARVYKNSEKEIGWFKVQRSSNVRPGDFLESFPPEFTAFHWHGDTFDLPYGARLLASTGACRHQAYAIGDRILGLQFHLEVQRENVEALIENCGHELVKAPFIQSAEKMKAAPKSFEEIKKKMVAILDRFEAVK